MGFGLGELLVLGCILFFILSAAQLGRMGNALGRFVYSFRKAARGEEYVDMPPLKRDGTVRKRNLPEAEQVDPPSRSS